MSRCLPNPRLDLRPLKYIKWFNLHISLVSFSLSLPPMHFSFRLTRALIQSVIPNGTDGEFFAIESKIEISGGSSTSGHQVRDEMAAYIGRPPSRLSCIDSAVIGVRAKVCSLESRVIHVGSCSSRRVKRLRGQGVKGRGKLVYMLTHLKLNSDLRFH